MSSMRAPRAPSAGLASVQRASSRPRCPSYLHHRPRPQTQNLHTTPVRPAKHRSPYRSITKAELQRIADARASLFPGYTKEERETVRHSYTPEQQRAIDLGEEAVNPYDLSRAKTRRDTLRPQYVDPHGFSRLQPVIDKRPSTARGEWDNTDDNQPTATLDYVPDEEKRAQALGNILAEPSDDPYEDAELDAAGNPKRDTLSDLWYMVKNNIPMSEKAQAAFAEFQVGPPSKGNILEEMEETVDEDNVPSIPANSKGDEYSDLQLLERIERNIPADVRDRPMPKLTTAQRLENAIRWRDHPDPPEFSQEIPKINDPRWVYTEGDEPADEDSNAASNDDEGAAAWARLAKQLQKSVPEIQRYRMKELVNKTVTNQTRLGKIQSVYKLWVCGDGNGMLGLGEGKAAEYEIAMRTAQLNAVRNLKPIRRYEKRTIYGEVVGKVGAVELKLNARPPGFGLRCSSYVYEISKCAGLSDLQAKSMRSRNPMNVCKAMVEALQNQKDPEDVARARGKKMVDVRKVYYAGLV